MKKNLILILILQFYFLQSFAGNQLVSLLKERIIGISRDPYFQTKDQYDLAAAISNKGNTTDLSLRELYWNTYQQDSDLEEIMNTQQPDGSWKDINYQDQSLSNWDPTNHASRLLYLSRAYITPKSKFYHQKRVSVVLHRGLNYWFQTKPVCRNWWYNQIGLPRFMGLVFLFIENELSPAEKTEAIAVMNNAGFRMTGQNKVWLAGNVMIKALLSNDEKLVVSARDTIASEILITTQEGIQADFSFHQHGPQQQFGNYGMAFISGMAYYANIFGSSPLAFNSAQMDILRKYIFEGENWVVWNGYLDVSACNRQLFKQAQVGKALTLFVAINQIKQVDPLFLGRYDNILKRNLLHDAVLEKQEAKHFWRSDLTVFRNTTHYISVRSCSPRVKGTEFTNNENKKGHFISDGFTTILRKGDEYNDIFPLWDWNILPGVTAPVLETIKPDPKKDDYHNPNSFVGGLTHNKNGLSTFHLARNGVDAKKSWFYVNGKLICLGVDILSNTGKEIITGVNQCNQKGITLVVYKNGTTSLVNDSLIHSASFLSVWHDSIGYYFPEQTKASLSVEKQSGSWHDIADPYSAAIITGNVFKLWINHGINATESSYQYIVIPSVTPSQLKEYIQFPEIEILTNSSIVQAVKLKNNLLFEFVFHQPTRISTFTVKDYVEINKPGLLILERDKAHNVILTVADPTQKQNEINLIVSGRYFTEHSSYNVLKNQTEIVIPLPQNEYAGSAVSLTLKHN